MSFMIDRTCQKAAFLLGTALMLGTGLVTSDVLNVYATEAVDPAAAAQPTDPAATADPNAAAQPAVDPAVAQPMDPNAVTQPADPNAAADPHATTDTTTTTQPAAPKKQTVVLTEQLKKDIENSHAPGAKDAIINGYLSLLNKEYILKDELDIDLVSVGNGHQLERRSAKEITQMMKDAKSVGMRMNLTSAYRTYMKQVYLFKNKIERLEREGYSHEKAVKEAGTVVAVPGTSEHQLGLTLDFVTGSYKNLDEGIRNTKEYQWTEKHAWEYGYVIRYPKDKSAITGIISEPWHLGYVVVMIQSDAALRQVAGQYAYDDNEADTEELTLRSGGEEINEQLEQKLNERLAMAGMEVVEARINYLAYAPEIAAVMLRRQQASAIITAREKIVEGAVSMVKMALHKLSEEEIVELDEDKKAAMVSNLLVVLCADEAAQPVVNTGTLNH